LREGFGRISYEVFARYKRTTVVGVFPGEGSLVNLATMVMLRPTEDWAFRRYLGMDPLWAVEEKPTKIAT
jgi:putative transposase